VTVVGRGLSQRDCRDWRLLRVPSVLTVERFNGDIQIFRAVTIRRDDRPAADPPRTGATVKGQRKRGRSFAEQDRPWINAMHERRESSRDLQDAARAVVDLIIDGKKLRRDGNSESKVRRLCKRYREANGAWGSTRESV
jgi:hypothetical protein